MGTFTVKDIRKRGVQETIKMIAHFLRNVDTPVSINKIAVGVGLTPAVIQRVIDTDAGKHFMGTKKIQLVASIQKRALLNAKGRQAVKNLANSFGLRINEFSNDDILRFQLTRRDQNYDGFFNALNRSGIQYKTLKHRGPSWSFLVQLWPKGERPSGEKMKNNDNKTTGNDLDGSTYIRRALKLAHKLRIFASEAETLPASKLSFELADSISQDKGFLQALKTLKTFIEKRKNVDKDELLGWIIGRIAQLEKQIDMLEKQLRKTTKTFMSPEEK